MELVRNSLLIAYVLLETLYKTILGKYLAVPMERLQFVVGAALVCLVIFEWFRLNKENKIKWIKRHLIVFVYFAVRIITFINVGFAYTMLRSLFFEGIYLLVLTELILDSKFCKDILFKIFIAINLILNIANTFFYLYCNNAEASGTAATDTVYLFANTYTHIADFEWFNYSSMYSNPNQIGLMTGLAMILALNYISKNMNSIQKILATAYFAFSAYCLWYSNCSSSHVGMIAVAGAFILVTKAKFFDRKRIILTCLGCCILATGCIYTITAVNDEYGPFTPFEDKINILSTQRYTIWKDSFYSHKDEALLGCGNMTLEKRDRYQYNLDKGIDKGLDINGSLIDYVGPHNGYIGTISCAGILGFLAFLAVILKKIKDSRSLNENYWYLAIVFILVINLFECMMPVSKNFITMYMFMIISMDDREELA